MELLPFAAADSVSLYPALVPMVNAPTVAVSKVIPVIVRLASITIGVAEDPNPPLTAVLKVAMSPVV